jgi:hypothetical protein
MGHRGRAMVKYTITHDIYEQPTDNDTVQTLRHTHRLTSLSIYDVCTKGIYLSSHSLSLNIYIFNIQIHIIHDIITISIFGNVFEFHCSLLS